MMRHPEDPSVHVFPSHGPLPLFAVAGENRRWCEKRLGRSMNNVSVVLWLFVVVVKKIQSKPRAERKDCGEGK